MSNTIFLLYFKFFKTLGDNTAFNNVKKQKHIKDRNIFLFLLLFSGMFPSAKKQN